MGMNKSLCSLAIAVIASLLAWGYALTRVYSWPTPKVIPLFAFPESVLCLLAFLAALFTASTAIKRYSKISGRVICVSLFLFVFATALFTGSTRLNYFYFNKRQFADIRKMLDTQTFKHMGAPQQAEQDAAANP